MRKVIITAILIVVGVIVGVAYACDQDPDVTLTASPTTAYSLQTITFDATASFDPDGPSAPPFTSWVHWAYWDWVFNTGPDQTDAGGTGIATHVYSTEGPGSYTCRVDIYDDDGIESGTVFPDHNNTDTATVTILSTYKIYIIQQAKSGGK